MPKIETFLKQEEIAEVEDRAKFIKISRSAYIRAAVTYALADLNFFRWLEDNADRFK